MTASQFIPILFLHSDRHKKLVNLLTEESLWTSCCHSSLISFLNNSVRLNVYSCPSVWPAERCSNKRCGEVRIFLSQAVDVGDLTGSRLSRFIPGEIAPGALWTGDWVYPMWALGRKDKYLPRPGFEPKFLGRLACLTGYLTGHRAIKRSDF
jgi:hypothetical protein